MSLAAGHRVITYDRRGFGASSRPSIGYDFDARVRAAVLLAPLLPGQRPGVAERFLRGHLRISPGSPLLRHRLPGGLREGLAQIGIPVLVIQGDQDRVLPYEATGMRLPALLADARSLVIAGGPHAITWTHAAEVNQALLDFIGHPGPADGRQSGSGNPGRIGERAGRLTVARLSWYDP